MSKGKKVIIFSILVLSLIGCLVIYWEREMPTRSTLPQSDCTRVQMYGYFFDDFVSFTPDEDAPERIMAAMEGIKVSRGPKWSTFRGDAFGIWLYFDGEKYPTTLTICEDGSMSVQDFETDQAKYYEGGQKLFQRILTITKEFPGESLLEK